MKIQIYGARGSIPVEGSSYTKYGGDTTCIEIVNCSGDIIVLDAGSGIRRLGNKHQTEDIKRISLLFTHYHWDHIIGFPFYKPVYNAEVTLDIYGPSYQDSKIKDIISGALLPPYFPICTNQMKAIINFRTIQDKQIINIGNTEITCKALNHPNGGIGYRFDDSGKSFVFLTDNELTDVHYDEFIDFVQEADLLIHDAEFTTEEYSQHLGWGHSNLERVLQLAEAAGVKQLGLFHHNQDRSDQALQDLESYCQQKTYTNIFVAYRDQQILLS